MLNFRVRDNDLVCKICRYVPGCVQLRTQNASSAGPPPTSPNLGGPAANVCLMQATPAAPRRVPCQQSKSDVPHEAYKEIDDPHGLGSKNVDSIRSSRVC